MHIKYFKKFALHPFIIEFLVCVSESKIHENGVANTVRNHGRFGRALKGKYRFIVNEFRGRCMLAEQDGCMSAAAQNSLS